MDFKNRVREKPTFANINLQGPCNLKCYFCIGCDFQNKPDANYLNTHFSKWNNFNEYLELLKRDGINKIYLTGQNTDPLLYKYLDELIEYLESVGFIVGIRTNGLQVKERMDSINKLNGSISFSIHSLNPDTNELITGSKYTLDLEELDELVSVPYRIAIVVNRYNCLEIEDMILKLSKLKNLKYIQVRGIATDNNYETYKEDIRLFNKLSEYFSKKYEKKGEYYTSKIYNIGNTEVSMWKTVDTTINSYNYFTDGIISKNYFIVEGYDRRIREVEKRYGFMRVGACVPELKISNVEFNVEKIKESMHEAEKNGVEILTFPELSLTGYTCADLFLNGYLIDEAMNGLIELKEESKHVKGVFIVGVPIKADNQLFNCAAVIENGHILGIVPKTYIPNYGEFYEKRWFSEDNRRISDKIIIDGESVPFKTNILFREGKDARRTFGIEICEDLWCTYPPSNDLTIRGAKMIFNLSASNEIIGKCEYRKNLVKSQSEKTISAYIYASSGINESTTDLVFSGASFIYENGKKLSENKRFDFNSNMIFNDVDLARIENMRIKDISYMGVIKDRELEYEVVEFDGYNPDNKLVRSYDEYPFVPSNPAYRNERCEEILNIQAHALAKRLKATGIQKCVIGISGGLDSTLAFLVVIKAFDILGLPHENILGITMPGFGTTNRTYTNACRFVELYGATLKEVSIKDACLQHFKDIDHDPANLDVTYENVQARERTQILMDYANKVGALVIGTGDLSELALGWCTYNGDHMSMYAVNVSIPKTLVRYLVKYYGETEESEERRKIIMDILDTPVSPELLPPSESGEILQVTENTIGPYVLHDFFLYHFLRYGADPIKIFYLACETFKEMKREEIKKWLLVFVKRFFSQQFKRSCLPDGPKVGTISVSPRGDLRMPSDASVEGWIKELKNMK